MLVGGPGFVSFLAGAGFVSLVGLVPFVGVVPLAGAVSFFFGYSGLVCVNEISIY